jgi:N-acetylglucosaminyldiphosphoundecaprenol N-acetyl-beta-D-mannosaminyltransferase
MISDKSDTQARPRNGACVLGTFIDALDQESARSRILAWAANRESRAVYLCNVHSVVTAHRDPQFQQVLDGADLAAPDGAPVAWALRRLGQTVPHRVCGPDLMWHLMGDAERRQLRVYFYGSSPTTLARLRQAIVTAYPGVQIAGMHSPPYRPLSAGEQQTLVENINATRPHLVFVGLGCPKQEAWIMARRGEIAAVMLGVGAAFDFHAGVIPRAPRWMRDYGLEWLHRLATNPKRLARRYLVTNSVFMLRFLQQWLFKRKADA